MCIKMNKNISKLLSVNFLYNFKNIVDFVHFIKTTSVFMFYLIKFPRKCRIFKTRKKKCRPWLSGRNFLHAKLFLLLFFISFFVTVHSAAVFPENNETTTSIQDQIFTTASSSMDHVTTVEPTVKFRNVRLKNHKAIPIEHAGVPRSIHIEPFLSDPKADFLQLNVTWKPPKGYIEDYTMEVKALNHSQTCKITLCYVDHISSSSHWSLIPQDPPPPVNDPVCEINPGCSYAVVLRANPWAGKINATAEITLPDCIDNSRMCNCEHKYNIAPPVVGGNIVNDSFINITWTYVNSSSIEHNLMEYEIKVDDFIFPHKPLRTHVAHDEGIETMSHLINITDLLERSSKIDLLENNLKKGRTYTVTVFGIDRRRCFWPEGQFTIRKPDEAIEIPAVTMILKVLIVILALLLVIVCLAVSLSRCRLCSWLKTMLAPRVIGMHSESNGHIRRQDAWPGQRY